MKILDFFKALFLPRSMQRFRYMSILFAICLFILSMYAIILPARSYYSKNTHKLAEENNLYYLQSLLEMPTLGEEISDFVEEVKEKECLTDVGTMTCKNLGISSINIDSSVVCYLTKDTSSGRWFFNGSDTGIAYASESDVPTVSGDENKLIINNITTKPVDKDGITKDDTFTVITLTVNDKRLLKINDTIYESAYISSDSLDVKVVDQFLYVNDINTNYEVTNKLVINFIPNSDITYYERVFTYVDKDQITNNIKVIIDLSVNSTTQAQYPYSSESYPNIQNEAYYFITINKLSIFYQAHLSGIAEEQIVRNDVQLQTSTITTYFVDVPMDLTTVESSKFGLYLGQVIEEGFKELAIQSFSFLAFIYCVLYPVIIALIFFLLFKRTGKLKTFKEYYNIASICNIVPTLIAVIIVLINPVWFGQIYLFIFAVYYLFTLYRINNSPKLE